MQLVMEYFNIAFRSLSSSMNNLKVEFESLQNEIRYEIEGKE